MNIDETIKANDKVVLDFYADWCMPCKMLAPILETLGDDIKVEKINVEEYPELAEDYSIVSIPTIFTFKDGELKTTFTGVITKNKILESFNS